MNDSHNDHLEKGLEEIWHQVPPDYYQKGVSNNLLQKIWHNKKLKMILNLVNESSVNPKNILDVGCASGWFLSQLHQNFPKSQASGVDVYKDAITHGKKQYKFLKLVYGDAHKLPFLNESFDLVVCTEVLEHVVDPQGVLKEIKRVLTPNGITIIEMDTGNFLFTMIWYWWTHLRRGVWRDSHIHVFNTKKLEDLIEKSGFLIKEKKFFNFTMAVAFLLKKGEK